MPKFRCPRCGAIVEGLHDRCPRCNVLFKYRKEDMDLLTPYKAPVVEQPERIEERPVPEAMPVVEEKPVVMEEAKVEEAPVIEEVEAPKEAAPEKGKKGKKEKKALTPEQKRKSAKSGFIFALLGFLFALFGGGWIALEFVPILGLIPIFFNTLFLGFPLLVAELFGLLGFIFSIVGISKCSKGKGYPRAKGGKVLGIFGLLLAIFFWLIPTVLMIVIFFLFLFVGVAGGIVVGILYLLPLLQQGSEGLALLAAFLI